MFEKIKFDEKVINEVLDEVSYFFTCPKEILKEFKIYDKDAVSAELSIQLPMEDMNPRKALVLLSPTVEINENEYEDTDWNEIDIPLAEIEELLKMAENENR